MAGASDKSSRAVLPDDLQRIRLAVASHDATATEWVRQAAAGIDDIAIVAVVPAEPRSVELILEPPPDVLIITTPGDDDDAATLIKTATTAPGSDPPLVLLLLTGDLEPHAPWLGTALRHGARGVIAPGPDGRALLGHAVRVALAGQVVLPSELREYVVQSWCPEAGEASGNAALDALTRRERDVLRLVALGHSNAEISTELRLSETTVKSHLRRILGKLGQRNRVRLVILAHEAGLV